MEFRIGIYGGMGPFTGYAFFGKIIDHLKKLPINDSQHPQIIFYSDPTMPRRDYCVLAIENALATQTSETVMTAKIDPSVDARPSLLFGLEVFKKCDRILVPCNTFHYFLPDLKNNYPNLVNMIAVVAKKVMEKGSKKVGLLATAATIHARIYHKELSGYEIEDLHQEDEKEQLDKVQAIINLVKANEAHTQKAKTLLEEAIRYLENKQVGCIILGCTELPIVHTYHDCAHAVDLLDSSELLAEDAVNTFYQKYLEKAIKAKL
jgi:aspartate racemase